MSDKAEEQVRFGTVEGWAKEFGVPVEKLTELLKDVTPIVGRTPEGQIRDAYSEADVRRVLREDEDD